MDKVFGLPFFHPGHVMLLWTVSFWQYSKVVFKSVEYMTAPDTFA